MGYFCLQRWSIVLLCAQISTQYLDNLICKTKNCLHSVDAHFHDGVTHMLSSVSYENAASTSYINTCLEVTLRLDMMQDQKWLKLHWRTFSVLGLEHVDIVFAAKHSQCLIYGCLQPITTSVSQNAKPTIIDAPLTLIFEMGKSLCHLLFCLTRLLIG
jgi:hypothetical protein